MKEEPLISIILTFYNEEIVLPMLISRLEKALESIGGIYELIFVDDASNDGSLALLGQYSAGDSRIKVITTSRRFGQAECCLLGMEHARGRAVVTMDTDLQDPPEVIPELVEKWKEGADVVYTVRSSRKAEHPLKMCLTKNAYRFIKALTPGVDLPVEAGDFKLLSRRVLDHLLKMKETDPYPRGMIPWIGFKQVPVYYHREGRAGGEHHFPVFRHCLRDLATFHGPVGTFASGLTSSSIVPLVFIFLAGLALTFFAAVGGLVLLLLVFSGLIVSTNLCWALLFGGITGVQLLALGVVGIYLGRLYRQAQGRPRAIAAHKINLG